MKLIDVLNSLFGAKLEEEIDIVDSSSTDTNKNNDSTKTEETVESESNNKTVESNNEQSENKTEGIKNENLQEENKEDNMAVIFEDGWIDTSGKISFDKIKDEAVSAEIKKLYDIIEAERGQRAISDSLNASLKDYQLNVSVDTLRKVIDLSGVKIDENGTVNGIKEALEALKTTEPGFFKNKETESSPLNEGFNPVERKSTMTEDEIVALAYGQDE